jgi:ParB family chromosome partitioning protein
LGKGIDALLQGRPLDQLSQLTSITQVSVDQIEPNPHQPRKQFNDASLAELADSIRERGVIQPILAEERADGTYTIIAGERRYRAAKLAGLDEVPVITQDFTEEEKLEIALIENIQREDLNPLDEARAIQSALELSGSTQEELAKRLGKSRPAVANALRLLKLESGIQDSILSGDLSAGHARVLVSLQDKAARARLFKRIQDEQLSVRAAEAAAKDITSGDTDHTQITEPEIAVEGPATTSKDAEPQALSTELKKIQELLIDHFGTRVAIRGTDEKGKVEIPYLSTEDLERVLEIIGVPLE